MTGFDKILLFKNKICNKIKQEVFLININTQFKGKCTKIQMGLIMSNKNKYLELISFEALNLKQFDILYFKTKVKENFMVSLKISNTVKK